MQATLDASALKPFTKALMCLSKYGDELSIYATTDSLSFSATNSSKSAYCRFKYESPFFSKYRIGMPQSTTDQADGAQKASIITGLLLTKSFLSILKHRTVEKTVERCELSIVEEAQRAGNEVIGEDLDNVNKLIIRMHCKHGVVKTHRLPLQLQTSLMAPGVPDSNNESHLNIGPRALKDIIDHFPLFKGTKSDPQLVWTFGDSEVDLRSLESSVDSRGKGQLSTELTISSEEFDIYNVYSTPTTIAFHLREFNATIAFADSMALSLDLRFTDPAAPLFIDVEGDYSNTLFVISTSQVNGGQSSANLSPPENHVNNRKRDREETPGEAPRIKKPMKAVQRAETPFGASAGPQSRAESRLPSSMPPPASLPRSAVYHPANLNSQYDAMPPPPPPPAASVRVREPLFLPSSSQLSAADEEVLRSTGLGVESMNINELAAFLEDEGEEVAFDFGSQAPMNLSPDEYQDESKHHDNGPDSLEIVDELELESTQSSFNNPKTFHPLFED